MTILATIGLTQDQAVQVANIIRLVEEATFAGASNDSEARRIRDRERKYAARHSEECPRTSAEVVGHGGTSAEVPSRARVLYGAEVLLPPDDDKSSSTPKGVERSRRGTRLPDDWQPSEAHKERASKLGLSAEDLAKIAEEYRNYWHSEAGARARKINWDLTFTNRIVYQAPRYLKEKQRDGRNGKARKGSLIDAGVELIQELDSVRTPESNDICDDVVRLLQGGRS